MLYGYRITPLFFFAFLCLIRCSSFFCLAHSTDCGRSWMLLLLSFFSLCLFLVSSSSPSSRRRRCSWMLNVFSNERLEHSKKKIVQHSECIATTVKRNWYKVDTNFRWKCTTKNQIQTKKSVGTIASYATMKLPLQTSQDKEKKKTTNTISGI